MLYQINHFLFAILAVGNYYNSIQAFVPRSMPMSLPNAYVFHHNAAFVSSSRTATDVFTKRTTIQMASDDSEKETLSFDDAGAAIVDEDEKARAERSGTGNSDEKNLEFEAKKTEYDSMRDKIRARATDLNIEKSVTTQKAIEEANRRAMAREEPQELDLSKFGMGTIGEDPEDELTDKQMESIDKSSQMSILDQASEEFNNARFPTFGATLRQTAFMLVIFSFTATYILFLDGFVRDFYTDVLKIIPGPDAVFDYSDLDLPDGWTDMMNEADLLKQ